MIETRPEDHEWMAQAVRLSQRSPTSPTAYSVGAIIVHNGQEIANGYSRETDPHVHAEESALRKLGDDPRLRSATIYSTLEPCSERRSSPHSCTQLILAAGIPRVVIGYREPSMLVQDCVGVEQLEAAGVEVVELPDFAAEVIEVNAHITSRREP